MLAPSGYNIHRAMMLLVGKYSRFLGT